MTQDQAYGMLVLFGIVAVMYVRSREVSGWQATVFTFFGFSLACTGPGYLVVWILHFIFGAFK
jgi:hypothetical protein